MTTGELQALVTKLYGIYGERFPGLTPGMVDVWMDALVHIDHDLVDQALRRWAHHHTFKPPSLDELLEQVEFVREDQQRARRAFTNPAPVSFIDVIKEAGEAVAANPERTRDDVLFARLMVRLTERSCNKWQDRQGMWHEKLTMEQRGEQCYAWADHYQPTRPALADDLRAAARQFAKLVFADTHVPLTTSSCT